MREFIDLLEAASDTVTLYRGDSSKIDQFDISYTDERALFGVGIYLTSDSSVAKDYTVKARDDSNVVFRSREEERPTTTAQLTAEYLRFLANPGYDPRRDGKPGELGQKIADIKAYWQDEYRERSKHLDWTDKESRSAINDDVIVGFRKEKTDAIRKAVERAKAEFKRQRPDLRIVRLTTGEYIFTKKDRGGTVTTFEVPKSYLAKCLDVERPLSDKLLALVKATFTAAHPKKDPNALWDLRHWDKDGDEKMGNTFDDFIKGFKKYGARYAWTKDGEMRTDGANGKNPSLDYLWNGSHAGFHVFQNDKAKQLEFAKSLQAIGYVGYFYDGGIRVTGGGARGGGGTRHDAYAFWDDKMINTFRTEHTGVVDDEVGDLQKGVRANKVYR